MAAVINVPCFCLTIFCLFLRFCVLNGENVLGEENDDFDFDGLPGVQHEFKVDIPGGAEECFFQKAARGAKFYVSFEVCMHKFLLLYITD